MPELYSGFGLTLRSPYALPLRKISGGSTPDVSIRQESLTTPAGFLTEARRSAVVDEGRVFLAWADVGHFCISPQAIRVAPASSAEDRLISAFLSGAALGVLLHLRGFITLHASAVFVQDTAVAFMGAKGMGKSTMASVFCRHGASLVSDDVLVVDPATLRVYPGGRFCKLAPDVAASVSQVPSDQLPAVYQKTRKRYWEPGRRYDEDLPLGRIYLLEYFNGEYPEIKPMSKRDATLALLRNSYALRFLETTIDGASHLDHSARIAREIPMRRLKRGAEIEHISTVLRKVEADLT